MYYEEVGDITDIPEGAIAHCITADYSLGAGVAKELDEKYSLKSTLMNIGQHVYPDCLVVDTGDVAVFNLVTKENRYSRPTYESLEECISEMKSKMKEKDIKYIYVPKLGCGKDRLDWTRVREILKKYFEKDEDLELIVLLRLK